MGFIIFARANSRMFNHIILLLTNNLKPINQNERGNFDYEEQILITMRPLGQNSAIRNTWYELQAKDMI